MAVPTPGEVFDTADGSSGVIVRASGINSLDPRRREIICRPTYTQHVTIWCQNWFTNLNATSYDLYCHMMKMEEVMECLLAAQEDFIARMDTDSKAWREKADTDRKAW
jgi:aspartate/tyrosine/aromatic aminotransferase